MRSIKIMDALLRNGISISAKGVVVPVIETIVHTSLPTPRGLDVHLLTEPAANAHYTSNRGPSLEWKGSGAWTGLGRRDLSAVSRHISQQLTGGNCS